MKRGDFVKCKREEGEIVGMLLSVDSPSNLFWNEYSPKRITVIDFDGMRHNVDLWSASDIEFLKDW